ncbi:MAG: helix-turn-helix domain-containing protein [Limnothrix sp.]
MGDCTKYNVRLTSEQRESLQQIARNGYQSAKKILHARILLMADLAHPEGNWTDQQIAQALSVHQNTVARIRKLFATGGKDFALNRKVREVPPIPKKIAGTKAKKLLALCADSPPPGHDYWSLSLLVSELKRRGLVDSICRETVRQVLKQHGVVLSRKKRSA